MKPTIIFDLDGTLAHTGPDLLASLNHSIEPFSIEPLQQDQLGHLVGHGSIAMIERAFKLRNVELGDTVRQNCQTRFLEYYSKNIAVHTKLFPGAQKLLDDLIKGGYTLAVCTNKQVDFANQLLEELGIKPLFATVTGGDSFTFRKPDGRHLLETIKLAGGTSNNAIMVGDTITDINAAKDASIPVIAVDFGYTDVELETLKPDHIISHFDEAIALINASH